MPSYQYVRIGGRSFCLQQNFAILAWCLNFNGKPFSFGGKGAKRTLRDMQGILSLVKKLAQYRAHLPDDGSVLELPIRANLCLQVHNGYKVFNLQRNAVVKVFSPEIDPETVSGEIERAQNVGRYSFAPSIRQWSVEERWYEEDYVNGYQAKFSDWKTFLRTFQQWLAPIVESMILTCQSKVVDTLEYSCEKKNILAGKKNKLSNNRLDADKVGMIRDFVDSMIERLRTAGHRQIHLVFSHGDFSPKHVLITDHGGVAIDWETAGHRSPLFDLHNAFFQQLWLKHATPGIVGELNSAISSLQSRLTLSAPDMAKLLPLLSSAEFYRQLYYIERVCRIVEVHEMNDRMIDNILRWINAFNRYEKILVDGADRSTQSHQA
jgi:thiamine kinase-like enzyme